MASINLAGVLRLPNGDPAVGDIVRFTHISTTGETVATASTCRDIIMPPDGSYDINIEYGKIMVEYRSCRGSFKNVGIVVVNQDSTATTIPELLNAAVPPTDDQLLAFQLLVQEAKQYSDIAQAAAEQITASELILNNVSYPVGTILRISGYTTAGDGGSASWKFNGVTGQTPSQSPSELGDALINDASGNQWELVDQIHGSPLEQVGLIADGVTSDSAVLTAMTFFKARKGGGDIIAPAKTIAIDGIYVINSPSIRFIGAGHDCNLFSLVTKGTVLKWVGAASSGYMMGVRTFDSELSKKVGGVVVKGVCFDGNGLCARGLNLRTVDNCTFIDLAFQRVTEWGVYTDTNINVPNGGTTIEALDNQHNYFEGILVNLTAMTDAGGIKLTANPLSPPSNTSMNEMHNLSIRIENGDALHFGNSDSNTIQHFRVFRTIVHTGNAVVYDEQLADPAPNTNFMYSRTNVIYHMHTAQAGIVVNDTPGAFKPAVDNVIYGYNLDGNAPNVSVTRNSEKSLKIFSARNSELPSVNGVALAATSFSQGNTRAVEAINARDALGLPSNPAQYLYKDDPNALHQVFDDGNGNVFSIEVNEGTGNFVINNISGGGKIEFNEALQLQGQPVSTSATSGAGSALPANPQAYITVIINGVARKIPFYPE